MLNQVSSIIRAVLGDREYAVRKSEDGYHYYKINSESFDKYIYFESDEISEDELGIQLEDYLEKDNDMVFIIKYIEGDEVEVYPFKFSFDGTEEDLKKSISYARLSAYEYLCFHNQFTYN